MCSDKRVRCVSLISVEDRVREDATWAILLDARNSGCCFYDAVKDGEDEEKLRGCASLIVFLDHAFLSDTHLAGILLKKLVRPCSLSIFQSESADTSPDSHRHLVMEGEMV